MKLLMKIENKKESRVGVDWWKVEFFFMDDTNVETKRRKKSSLII